MQYIGVRWLFRYTSCRNSETSRLVGRMACYINMRFCLSIKPQLYSRSSKSILPRAQWVIQGLILSTLLELIRVLLLQEIRQLLAESHKVGIVLARNREREARSAAGIRTRQGGQKAREWWSGGVGELITWPSQCQSSYECRGCSYWLLVGDGDGEGKRRWRCVICAVLQWRVLRNRLLMMADVVGDIGRMEGKEKE